MSEIRQGRRIRHVRLNLRLHELVQGTGESSCHHELVQGTEESSQDDRNETTVTGEQSAELWKLQTPDLLQQNKNLLESGNFSDTTFIVGQIPDCITFHCHKLMLAKASTVFGAMLFGSLAEKNFIHVTDIEPSIFEAMLQFIYTCRVVIKDINMALDLCIAADKYMIASLKEVCKKHMMIHLVPENVCQVYEVAKALNLTKLTERALKLMVEHTSDVLCTTAFLTAASQETLLLLVQQESLNIKSEAVLITACLRWARYQSLSDETEVIRKNLGPIFKYLRFLTLTIEEFTYVTENSNALTDKEKCSILFILIKKDYFSKIPDGFATCIFSRHRKIISKPIFTFLKSLCYTDGSGVGSNVLDVRNIPYVNILDFKVDTDIYMIGFTALQPSLDCTSISYGAQAFSDYNTNVIDSLFLKGPSGIIDTGIINNYGHFRNLVCPNHHKYKFEKKVFLRKNELYTITLISNILLFTDPSILTSFDGRNLYNDESVAGNTLCSTLIGIVYKLA